MNLIALITSLLLTPAVLTQSWPNSLDNRGQKVLAPLLHSSEAYLLPTLYPHASCPRGSYWHCETLSDLVVCRCFWFAEPASARFSAYTSSNDKIRSSPGPTSLNVSMQLEPGNDDSR